MPARSGSSSSKSSARSNLNCRSSCSPERGSEEVASDAISAGVTDYLQKETGTEQYTLLANRIQNAVEADSQRLRPSAAAPFNSCYEIARRSV